MLLVTFAEDDVMLFALAVLPLCRSRSKASTVSCIFFEMTGSIDRANELVLLTVSVLVKAKFHVTKLGCTRGKVGPG